MTNIIAQILEMDLHALEDAEQDALLSLLRGGHSLITRRPPRSGPDRATPKPDPVTKPEKDANTLMARQTVTDDQIITLTFALTDADKVAVEGSSAPVVVTTVDDSGADVSKWINVAQDSADPLKFVLSRKPNDDGSQPQEISFSSIGTLQVGAQTKTRQDDYLYTPGAPENLSSTVVIGAAPVPASGDASAGAEGAAQVQQQA